MGNAKTEREKRRRTRNKLRNQGKLGTSEILKATYIRLCSKVEICSCN